MRSFSTLFTRRWNAPPLSELPPIDPSDDAERLDYALLAGGLALFLSRCSETQVDCGFSASRTAYQTLKTRLRSGGPVWLLAEDLLDVSHEIAEVADSATRRAARRYLDREAPPSPVTAFHASPGAYLAAA